MTVSAGCLKILGCSSGV